MRSEVLCAQGPHSPPPLQTTVRPTAPSMGALQIYKINYFKSYAFPLLQGHFPHINPHSYNLVCLQCLLIAIQV